MKVIGFVEVDPAANGLGSRPRWQELLGGRPVLRRVVERAARVPGLEGVFVACPGAAVEAVRGLLAGTPATVFAAELADLPQRETLRRRRAWSDQGWQGGVGRAFVWDEEGTPAVVLDGLQRADAQGALVFSPSAPLVDLGIARCIREHLASASSLHMAYSAAPPGLAPWAVSADLAGDLTKMGLTLGEWLDVVRRGMSALLEAGSQAACIGLPLAVKASPFRFTWDSDHQTAFLAALWQGLGERAEDAGAEDWVRAAAADPLATRGDHPRLLEVELTTESPVRCRHCPLGDPCGRGGRMERALAERILAWAGTWDDVLVTLGGRGDPLRHPDLPDLLEAARAARIRGVHLQTQALDLHGALLDAVLSGAVHVVSVCLDATGPDSWSRVKEPAGFAAVVANLDRFLAARKAAGRAWPFLVVEMVRTRANENEVESFWDAWQGRADAVVIRDHDSCAGQRADLSPIHLHPPERGICRRLQSKLTVRWDGTVPLCDEDLEGRVCLGNAVSDSLDALWAGARIEDVRVRHRAGRFAELELCRACTVWHAL